MRLRTINEAVEGEVIYDDGTIIGKIDKWNEYTNYTTGRIAFTIDGKLMGNILYDMGDGFSLGIPPDKKELYLSTIEIQKTYRGKNYSKTMLDALKSFAKKEGVDIITLRVDYGYGSPSTRGGKLEKLYLDNGFVYTFTEEEVSKDEEKSLMAMHYEVK